MAEKKKKEKTNVVLPKAWQSVKHRNETAQARANYDDTWKAVGYIVIFLLIAFVLLGGVSQTGVLRFFFNWSTTVGEKVSSWFEGGSIITNEDGIYYDPTGQKGERIGGDDEAPEVVNPADEIDFIIEENDFSNDNGETETNTNEGNSEVQEE